jgi:formylmethanofuran dehydrogenase subunit C
MPLSLTPVAPTADAPLSIEFDGILPDRLEGLSIDAIRHLPVLADGVPRPLADLFVVAGDGGDGLIICNGDFSRVHRLAAGMRRGTMHVRGSVGRHAAEGMSGGTLTVEGDAGDWLAAALAGGSVRVEGNAGDNAAAALPGSRSGVSGGIVVINGAAGGLAGARMRRGVLAIGGGCGEGAAFELLAGTVIVAGRVGRRCGTGMRRGSFVALSSQPDLPPTFRRGATWSPGFLPLLAGRLAAAGFRDAAAGNGAPAPSGASSGSWSGAWQQWHGDVLAGGRGEVFHRPAC